MHEYAAEMLKMHNNANVLRNTTMCNKSTTTRTRAWKKTQTRHVTGNATVVIKCTTHVRLQCPFVCFLALVWFRNVIALHAPRLESHRLFIYVIVFRSCASALPHSRSSTPSRFATYNGTPTENVENGSFEVLGAFSFIFERKCIKPSISKRPVHILIYFAPVDVGFDFRNF